MYTLYTSVHLSFFISCNFSRSALLFLMCVYEILKPSFVRFRVSSFSLSIPVSSHPFLSFLFSFLCCVLPLFSSFFPVTSLLPSSFPLLLFFSVSSSLLFFSFLSFFSLSFFNLRQHGLSLTLLLEHPITPNTSSMLVRTLRPYSFDFFILCFHSAAFIL